MSNSSNKPYDFIVVGKGPVGSAAAKYLAINGGRVLLIGASTSKDADNNLVFGQHNEGKTTMSFYSILLAFC
jgi:choline dehydrogenase-like flavoprotein